MLALFIILGLWVIYESTIVAIDHLDVFIKLLPAELEGFRIVHISDFHGRKLAAESSLLEQIRAEKPHAIALTGDYVDRSCVEVDNILPFISSLTAIAPTYAVSGNHDHDTGWDTIASSLRAIGVQVLENEHRIVEYNGSTLVIAGVSDPFTNNANLHDALSGVPITTTLLLAHAPTWFEASKHRLARVTFDTPNSINDALQAVDLTLTGHTHGGQIKLPLVGALSNASGRMFPRDYIEGLSQEGNNWLYISRGIGYTLMPVRFLSRSQITIITLRAKS